MTSSAKLTNIINFHDEQQRKKEQEYTAGEALARELGIEIDREQARNFWLYRNRSNYSFSLCADELRFCEALEEQIAARDARRAVVGRTNGYARDDAGINWDRHERQQSERSRGNGFAAGGFAEPKNEWPTSTPLPYVDLALELTPREWLVHERIPMRNVTSLSGEGSIGKSLLLMQLSGAVVLGKDWIGTLPEPGPVLYLSCEEDDQEVRRRMEDVARHLDSTRQELIDRGLKVLSFAGKDAILGQFDRAGIIRPTPLFERIRQAAVTLHPKLIVLDPIADVFAGKEIERSHTRQFITMLRGLAIETGSAVVMAAHPSLTGISSNTGLSGSTAWHNSVRARMYFKPTPGDDKALRVLEVRKNNYGPEAENILLRWKDGVYVIEPGEGTLEQLHAEAEDDFLFLKLLRRFMEQGRNVSDKSGPTYAPALFAKQKEAKTAKITSKDLADAMERLFAAGKMKVITEGRPSKQRTKIVEIEGVPNDPPNDPPNAAQRRPTGGAAHTPHTPQPVGRADWALGAPAAPAGLSEATAAGAMFQIIGPEPLHPCVQCGATTGQRYLIRDPFRSVESHPLHEHCAAAWFKRE
jgi:RecA-family ATPase